MAAVPFTKRDELRLAVGIHSSTSGYLLIPLPFPPHQARRAPQKISARNSETCFRFSNPTSVILFSSFLLFLVFRLVLVLFFFFFDLLLYRHRCCRPTTTDGNQGQQKKKTTERASTFRCLPPSHRRRSRCSPSQRYQPRHRRQDAHGSTATRSRGCGCSNPDLQCPLPFL